MRIGRNEIIEELTEHIRQSGGESGEWRVGTAEGQWLVVSGQWLANTSGEGLAFREAHTTYAADDAVDYLVNAFGLKLAPQAERRSALQNPAPGRIVFVYRKNPLPLAASPNAQATLHKVAA